MFRYGYQRAQYSGCINQETPGQYLVTVPDFGDNAAAPTSAGSGAAVSTNSVSFAGDLGTVASLAHLAPRAATNTVRTLFWCATETDSDGYVSEVR